MAERIQLRRTKGWRKPENTVVVSRPSRWGNPYRVIRVTGGMYVVCGPDGPKDTDLCYETYSAAVEHAVFCFRRELVGIRALNAMAELRGKNLACWCPLPKDGEPDHCHAAVLLEVANG